MTFFPHCHRRLSSDGEGYHVLQSKTDFRCLQNFFAFAANGLKSDFNGHDNRHFRNVYGYVDNCWGFGQNNVRKTRTSTTSCHVMLVLYSLQFGCWALNLREGLQWFVNNTCVSNEAAGGFASDCKLHGGMVNHPQHGNLSCTCWTLHSYRNEHACFTRSPTCQSQCLQL